MTATSTKADNQSKVKKQQQNRNRKSNYEKSQRRLELDDLRKYKFVKVFNLDPEVYGILLTPADPDFPYAIAVLEFDLHLSRHYPHDANTTPPYISVKTDDISKGVAINVEQAFKKYSGTLRERITTLNENLEKILMMPAARTITIVKGPKTKPKSSSSIVKPTVDAQLNSKTLETLQKLHSNEKSASNDATVAPPNVEQLDLSSDSDSEPDDYQPNHDSDWQSKSESENDDEDGDEDYNHPSDNEDIDTGLSQEYTKTKREGPELSFPDIPMINVAILEFVSLNIVFQCGRCKQPNTFHNIQSATYGMPSKPLAQICSKCDLPLMVAFRKELLHSTCHTAGYLDVDGGRPVDLLPSSYLAMCMCGQYAPIIKNVDLGALRFIMCRHCHTKISLKIELFEFSLLSTETIGSSAKQESRLKLGPSAPKQKLNLTGGEPLPNYGTCEHYRKSTRWFRFSCCQRVFPCDKCHDVEMKHVCEQAVRMLCGYCSREQRFSSKCIYCAHDYTQRHTRFWEGGKGVRDKKLMSKKDKKKYKRDPIEHKKNEVHFQGKSVKINHD